MVEVDTLKPLPYMNKGTVVEVDRLKPPFRMMYALLSLALGVLSLLRMHWQAIFWQHIFFMTCWLL